MNVFEPLRTYSSPRRSAVVFRLATSEPASGSESPKEQRIGSSSSGGSHFACCSSLPAMITGPEPSPLAPIEVAIPEQPQFSSSRDEHAVEGGEAEAAEALGHVQVHQAELVRLRDHVGRVRLVLVVLGRLRPDLLLGEVARELAEVLLLLAQGERDARADSLLDRGHAVILRASID